MSFPTQPRPPRDRSADQVTHSEPAPNYQRSNYQGSAAPRAAAAPARPAPGARPELPPTTHTMKVKGGDYVPGVFITENNFGLFVNVKGEQGLPPGQYYINKKRPA